MENNNKDLEIIEASETVEENAKENKFKNLLSSVASFFKKFKSGKIKNEALLRRGGYSLAITAIVLAGVIVFNWLVASLGDRFNLEFDMTSDKKNSISQENIDYIKNLDADVSITVCGNEDEYAEYMTYYAQNYYGVTISSSSETEYFTQTVNLVDKYTDFNDRITVKYVDPQSTEFTAITTTYSSYQLAYGDMIVTSSAGGKERVKVLSFDDIYVISSSGSNSYYQSYTLAANKLETALTSAIAYVTSADSKKVAVLSGHSQNNYTDAYIELLTANNYDITTIDDKLITTISSDYDAIIISAPSIDFIGSELDVIANFLENDGKKGKGLIFFADATCPALPNFYAFLKQWGIEVSEGILFETDDYNLPVPNSPSTMGLYRVELEDDEITEKINVAIANYLVPMKVCEDSSLQITATALMQTQNSVVVAPIGSASTWADYTDADKKQFDCVIQSVDSDFDKDNNSITSYIMAFSSVEFVQSEWASYSQLSNQDIVMACTDRAAHVGDTSMTFTSKVITNESFATKVNASNTKLVAIVFMLAIPVVIIAAGIVVFVRRRNAR